MNLVIRKCRQCKAEVWYGPSDETVAILVTVDSAPLSPYGEALARLEGRGTYLRTAAGDGTVLRSRDHWQIGGGTPPRGDVVTDHRCGPDLPSIPSKLRTTPEGTMTDDPPF
jgi:hypothetical protein